jgi:hypothetical protein
LALIAQVTTIFDLRVGEMDLPKAEAEVELVVIIDLGLIVARLQRGALRTILKWAASQ